MSRASVFAIVAAFALLAPPARASDVIRVKLGSTIEELIAGPDGGAWVRIHRRTHDAIARATPDGRFRTQGVHETLSGGALGPDGQAWFQIEGARFVRSDARGNLSEIDSAERFGPTFATGPDGTLWSPTPNGDGFAHLTPQGTRTITRGGLPKSCRDGAILTAMERASDGAMWLSDAGCERLIRVAAGGTSAFAIDDPGALAADASAGMWVTTDVGLPTVAHVDAAGRITTYELSLPATDVAVAPDGSAWFALASCTLARVTPSGDITTAPSPIPALRIAFDPSGGMWLASRARLVHVAPGEGFGTCDERPPAVRVTPGRVGGSVSLRALRRGLRIQVRERVTVSGFAFYYDNGLGGRFELGRFLDAVVPEPRGRTLRYRVPAAQLRRYERRLAEGKRPSLDLVLVVADAEGNFVVVQHAVRVRR